MLESIRGFEEAIDMPFFLLVFVGIITVVGFFRDLLGLSGE
jgi:hypothetical protein